MIMEKISKTTKDELEAKHYIIERLKVMLEKAKHGESVRFIGILKTVDGETQSMAADFESLCIMLFHLAAQNRNFLEAAKLAIAAAEKFRKDKAREGLKES